ncbi:MAG: hypothetical protein O2856_03060 [Planctomycetota bacterium]|nr:hypothetical protein [Planctomycetota bacterium]
MKTEQSPKNAIPAHPRIQIEQGTIAADLKKCQSDNPKRRLIGGSRHGFSGFENISPQFCEEIIDFFMQVDIS